MIACLSGRRILASINRSVTAWIVINLHHDHNGHFVVMCRYQPRRIDFAEACCADRKFFAPIPQRYTSAPQVGDLVLEPLAFRQIRRGVQRCRFKGKDITSADAENEWHSNRRNGHWKECSIQRIVPYNDPPVEKPLIVLAVQRRTLSPNFQSIAGHRAPLLL